MGVGYEVPFATNTSGTHTVYHFIFLEYPAFHSVVRLASLGLPPH